MLKSYASLVPFLGLALGEHTEIVLHDLKDLNSSVIAIANEHISGRKIGSPTTDLVLKVLKEGLAENTNFITNYTAQVKGNRICRSSSFFIKDEQGEIIGVLCINVDVSHLIEVKNMLDKLINCATEKKISPAEKVPALDFAEVFENLHDSIDDALTAIIDSILGRYDAEPSRLSLDERMEIVRKLNENGLFLLKGGLSELAKRLEVSEPTVYRYLTKIKEIDAEQEKRK